VEINKGSLMQEITFLMDYLGINIFCDRDRFFPIWERFFSAALGPMIDTQRRTAFYQQMFKALAGVVILTDPIQEANQGDFVTLTIKGEGCKCITLELVSKFVKYLIDNDIEFKVTRFDIAWDNLGFSPSSLYQFMREHENDMKAIRSLAKRHTLKFFEQPFELDEKGNKGTSGVQFGSRQSNRMIRCYNMHGYTRLEFEMKEFRAHIVFLEVVSQEQEYRQETGLAHLLDFIDMEWQPWNEFIKGTIRAFCNLSNAREITAERTKKWLGRQVSVSLSVIQDLEPGFTAKLLAYGRIRKGRERYSALLSTDDLAGWQGVIEGD
jgi:DNA relaxase NicK